MGIFSIKALVGALIATCHSASSLKVGLLSDLHINLSYDQDLGPKSDKKGDCIKGSGDSTDLKAPMGRYGCDPPVVLLE